jgi:hypothetical protein
MAMSQGLLGLGAGLLAAGGPTTNPQQANLGFGLSTGLQGMNSMMGDYMGNALSAKKLEAQLAEAQRDADRRDKFSKTIQRLRGTGGDSTSLTDDEAKYTALSQNNGPTVDALSAYKNFKAAPPQSSQTSVRGITQEDLDIAESLGEEAGAKYIGDRLAKAREAPKSRDITRVGPTGEAVKISQEWDPNRGTWSDVGNAPAFAPPELQKLLATRAQFLETEGPAGFNTQAIEARIKKLGDSSGFSVTTNPDGTTDITFGDVSNLSKAKGAGMLAKLKEQEGEALVAVKQGVRIIDDLKKYGDRAIGLSGWSTRMFDTFVKQATAFSDTWKDNLDERFRNLVPSEGVQWQGVAAQSAALQSKVKYFAYSLISSLQGSRPSDRDLQNALDAIAANSGSSEQMAAAMWSVMQNSMDAYSIRYYTVKNEPYDWDRHLKNIGVTLPSLDGTQLNFVEPGVSRGTSPAESPKVHGYFPDGTPATSQSDPLGLYSGKGFRK